MVIGVVIALVLLGLGSWLVDRHRRRRNVRLDEQGLLNADAFHRVTGTALSARSEASLAEATFTVLGQTGGKN